VVSPWGCSVLVCSSVTLHSLGFSDFSRCVGNLCLVVITRVSKSVMLVPAETVLVLGEGPAHVENQVSGFFFLKKKKDKFKEKSHPAFDSQ